MITITDIRINLIPNSTNRQVAHVSFTVNDCLVLTSMKIVKANKATFLSMPRTKDRDSGEWRDLYFPKKKEVKSYINSLVMDAYNEMGGQEAPIDNGEENQEPPEY